MPTPCPTCARLNPPAAGYCYFDGVPLSGRVASGPVLARNASFSQPFVFPNGQAFTYFNQLVLACQRNWNQAGGFLAQGICADFFRILGRMDLVLVAEKARKQANPKEGLDFGGNLEMPVRMKIPVFTFPDGILFAVQRHFAMEALSSSGSTRFVSRNNSGRHLCRLEEESPCLARTKT